MEEFIRFIVVEAFDFGKGLYAFVVIVMTFELISRGIKRSVKWIGNKINQYRKTNTLY